ncbi:MAG: hypothetical protein LIO99_07400 [Clostridiales bacterium]|nr:hypothetical protein [Clostridiales bacterium]
MRVHIANLKSAQEAYEDAALAANEAEVTAARNMASANIPDASDSSVRQQEIAYEQMELTLNMLRELKVDGGKVYALADGLITGINITVGEKTSDGTTVKMADISKGFRFTAELSKEDQQYIGAGDLVTLTGNGGIAVEDLEVDSVTADDEEEDIYNIVNRAEQFLTRHGLSGKVISFVYLNAFARDLLLLAPLIIFLKGLRKEWRLLSHRQGRDKEPDESLHEMTGETLGKIQQNQFIEVMLCAMSAALLCLLVWMFRTKFEIPSDMIPTTWSDFSFWSSWW